MRRTSNQAGAAVLAALILVGAVGLFSLTLRALSPFYNVAYQQPHAQVAATAIPDICSNIATDHDPATGQKYCKCNNSQTNTTPKAPTGTSGAPGTSFTNSTFSCLPGCTYKSATAQADQISSAHTTTLSPDNATTQPGKVCTVYVCTDTSNNNCNQKISLMCDVSGKQCTKAGISGSGPNINQPGQLSPEALATAKKLTGAAQTDPQGAYKIATDYLGADPTPQKAGELWSALQSSCQTDLGTSCDKANNPTINGIQAQLQALAGQPLQSPGTPEGHPAVVPPPGRPGTLQPSDGADCILNPALCSDGAPSPLIPPQGARQRSDTTFGGDFMGGLNSLFGGGGGMTNGVMSFLTGFMRGMMGGGYGGYGGYGGTGGYGGYGSNSIPPGNSIPQYPGTCYTQYLCTGQTLLYRNDRCVDQPVQRCQYGCQSGGTQCAQQQNGQFGYGTDNQPCMQPPPQPSSSSCTVGVWKPTSATGNGCVSGWQCVANGQNGSAPTASLACQSQVADVNTNFKITYTCQNATASIGGGFDTGGQISGVASVLITPPPAGYNTATYTLACNNGSQTVGTQCSVQINQPAIALTANPSTVSSGATSTVGWVTSGMQTCVVSSPDMPGFTTQNANYTNVNGVAVTPAITATSRVFLDCKTFGGGTRSASTTIIVQ